MASMSDEQVEPEHGYREGEHPTQGSPDESRASLALGPAGPFSSYAPFVSAQLFPGHQGGIDACKLRRPLSPEGGEQSCAFPLLILLPRLYSFTVLRRVALPTTLTDDKAIAAAAIMGDSRIPK